MERLHHVIEVAALVACSAAHLVASPAQGICSLAVRVLLPNGQRPEVPISVTQADGRVEDKDQEPGAGDVRFCDLGILPVTVTVGSGGMCNQTTIKDVPLSVDETYLLVVTYDALACMETVRPPIPICRVLFRVLDSSGKWIPNARIALTTPVASVKTTDEYGRALVILESGDRLSGTATSMGFAPSQFSWACRASEPLHEQYLKMTRP